MEREMIELQHLDGTNGHAREDEYTISPTAGLVLRLEVTDPEVVAALQCYAEADQRNQYALAALRIGILSLRLASGNLDVTIIRGEGQSLIADVRELLSGRATELIQGIASMLKQYFEPETGMVPQRIQSLVKKDGELEGLLRSHLGPDESVLARTLVAHLGEGSLIFKMLSPTDGNGLRAQVAQTLEAALREQRERVLREFSLDNQDSALSRLIEEITTRQGELRGNLKEQMEGIVKEFSLDQPNSALSRLVSRVDKAQQAITQQFSTDNEQSALNRLSRLLQGTSEQIEKKLTLDDEQSPLSRLKREVQATLEEMARKNAEFHLQVGQTLAALDARKKEADQSPRHGNTFEEHLGNLLATEAQHIGDVYQSTGHFPGALNNCRTGDHVITLGSDSLAPSAKIVWEAKEDKGYTLKKALDEMGEGRKNRQAQIGVFVFSKKTAPAGLEPFRRYGDDIVIVWDADDATTDIYVRAAYSVARALTIRETMEVEETQEALRQIGQAICVVEAQIVHLDELRAWGSTVKGNGEKIVKAAEKMRVELEREIERVNNQLQALKTTIPQG